MRLTGCWIWLIPVTAMQFMIFDIHSLLRVGGCLWLDHFFSRGMDLDKVYIVDWKIRVQEDEVCHQQQDCTRLYGALV